MTKNRANPQRPHPPGNPSSPESDTESDTGAECPELSGNVRRIENSNLSHRQQAVLPVMASAPSLAQAARCPMSFAVRVCETEKLKKDIQDLEDALALSNAQHSVGYQHSVMKMR